MNFSIEERKENYLIIKAATRNIKMLTIRNLLFSLTLQAVRINKQGAPLLGLGKSIYYPNQNKYGRRVHVQGVLQLFNHFSHSSHNRVMSLAQPEN